MDPYSIIQAQAVMTLGEILEETSWTKTRPRARLLTRLRGSVGSGLIRVGTRLVAASGTDTRKQPVTA